MTPKTTDKPALTETQERMLSYCAKGHTVVQMAVAESVAIDTIKSRLRVLYGILGVDNRAAAVAAAQGWQDTLLAELRAKVFRQAGVLSHNTVVLREQAARLEELERDKERLLEELAKQRRLTAEWKQKHDDAVRRRTGWPGRNQGQM